MPNTASSPEQSKTPKTSGWRGTLRPPTSWLVLLELPPAAAPWFHTLQTAPAKAVKPQPKCHLHSSPALNRRGSSRSSNTATFCSEPVNTRSESADQSAAILSRVKA
ncbi:hypothetical protein NDU88_004125 [Pleurodeles waltl]|uniref:Uncharacterized protein n=1 Tax=Pleurodeles waltl TaxID=8319 RepID=A0AAV7MSK8_PLEWA|nr:hypothetical protein NDU88_004125 [Pleurodeles waltl]